MWRILGSLGLGVFASLFVVYPLLDANMLQEHNLLRTNRGLNPLVLNEQLSERARAHASKMAQSRRLFHSTIKAGESENIARGTNLTVVSAMKGWWKSSDHRKNILGNHTEMGYGIVKGPRNIVYYVVIFR
jgi:uncharacterized protein YkwD